METKPSRSERIRQAARKGDLNGGMKRRVRKVDDADRDTVAIGEAVKISPPANLATTRKTIGRPEYLYTEELADEFCRRVAEGHSVAWVCKADDMPSMDTVYRWRREKPAFADKYTQALEDRGMNYGDRIGELVDKVLSGEYPPDAVRVAVDALKWTSARLAPKQYGDKQTVDINQRIDVGSTAAGVLMRLTEQAKQARLEHQVIDITPSSD